MICIAFLKRDILHAGTFRENESIGLSLRRDFRFVIMQTITFVMFLCLKIMICNAVLRSVIFYKRVLSVK